MQDFNFYFQFGWEHIISKAALDHQLFIAVLAALYLFKDWKRILVLVTAFTIGHSLTLALSVLDIVRFNIDWVEFLIPCTIVLTAIANIFQKELSPKSMRINYLLALGFGLVHGMGFANTIRFMLVDDQNLAFSLLAFNLGLEAGQIVLVVALLLVGYVLVNLLKLNRRYWVLAVSCIAGGFALKIAIDRFPLYKKNNNEETVFVSRHLLPEYSISNQCAEYSKQCLL